MLPSYELRKIALELQIESKVAFHGIGMQEASARFFAAAISTAIIEIWKAKGLEWVEELAKNVGLHSRNRFAKLLAAKITGALHSRLRNISTVAGFRRSVSRDTIGKKPETESVLSKLQSQVMFNIMWTFMNQVPGLLEQFFLKILFPNYRDTEMGSQTSSIAIQKIIEGGKELARFVRMGLRIPNDFDKIPKYDFDEF